MHICDHYLWFFFFLSLTLCETVFQYNHNFRRPVAHNLFMASKILSNHKRSFYYFFFFTSLLQNAYELSLTLNHSSIV